MAKKKKKKKAAKRKKVEKPSKTMDLRPLFQQIKEAQSQLSKIQKKLDSIPPLCRRIRIYKAD
jgi:hypothetical protein